MTLVKMVGFHRELESWVKDDTKLEIDVWVDEAPFSSYPPTKLAEDLGFWGSRGTYARVHLL